ncbi:MAG: sigma-70 family RNA polymerase sigma factor [Deltaproteobacteria bacterium]|nr:sigma-70 family RNA polymerase sigma factor [Deltaproteobacteria bacterium]
MQDSRKRSSRDTLIEQYEPYVRHVVQRLVRSLGLAPDQVDEFTAAGYLGLVEAAEKFEAESGSSFRNYAYFRIRGAIIDALRNHSQLSDRAYRYAKALEAAQSMRRELSPEEWHKVSQNKDRNSRQSMAKILEYAMKGALVYRLSFSDLSNEQIEIPSLHSNPEALLGYKQTLLLMRNLVRTLPKRERKIVEDHYFNGKTFVQIAAEQGGVSKSWVSRLHGRAIERIKKRYFENES